MKSYIALAALLLTVNLFATSLSARELRNVNAETCKLIDQDGTIDSWNCPSTDNAIRCYADIQYDGGPKERVFGPGCWPNFASCWWNGPGAFDPCE